MVYGLGIVLGALLSLCVIFVFFKQKTAYEIRVSDWSSDVCSSDLVGSFAKGDAQVGTGMVGAPACGDVMKLQIKVNAEGVIEDAKFKTYGCGSAIADRKSVV